MSSIIVCALGINAAARAADLPQATTATVFLASSACNPAAPRVPEPLGTLEWVRDASLAEHVFSGEIVPHNPDASFDDPENAGIWAAIREIDLDGDGTCDLVVTAFNWVGTAGNRWGHAVFWFADAKGWRRQGPGSGKHADAVGMNAFSRALHSPNTKEDFLVYDFGYYAPVKLPDGRIALVVRAEGEPNPTTSAPVLAWDAKTRTIAPLAVDAGPLVAAVTKFCVDQQSEDPACITW